MVHVSRGTEEHEEIAEEKPLLEFLADEKDIADLAEGGYFGAKDILERRERAEKLTQEEKALFCRFAWGRSRMPERCKGVRFIVELVPLRSGVGQLPVAHTCSFQVDLPRYTSKEMLKENFQPATAIPGYTGRRRV